MDGRGGVDGFSTTYDGPLPVSSKDCSEMHDTGIWETHLGQQKVYMQKLSTKKIKQRRFFMHESDIKSRYGCVGATGPLYRSPKDPLSTINSLNKVVEATLTITLDDEAAILDLFGDIVNIPRLGLRLKVIDGKAEVEDIMLNEA